MFSEITETTCMVLSPFKLHQSDRSC